MKWRVQPSEILSGSRCSGARRACLKVEGHSVVKLRDVIPMTATDSTALEHACQIEAIMVTCNRNDFLKIAEEQHHFGIVILIRRKSHAAEAASVLRLVRAADASGLVGNINFA
jgi:hypothetical protein